MKNTKKGFIVPLLIAIIAVLAIGGGIYFYTQDKPASTVDSKIIADTQSTSTAQSKVISPTTDKTSAWKTYTNTSSGVSFQYPQAWAEPKLVLLSTRTTGAFTNGSISQYDNGFTFEIGTYYDQTKGRNLTVGEIVNNIKNQSFVGKLTQQNITVGGKSATRIDYSYNTGDTITEIYVSLDTNGNIFEASSDTKVIGADTFNKVINSLQFTTNPIVASSTTGWKTYTNSQYGFSFQYPQTYSTFSDYTDLSIFSFAGDPIQFIFATHANDLVNDDVSVAVALMDSYQYVNISGQVHVWYDAATGTCVGEDSFKRTEANDEKNNNLTSQSFGGCYVGNPGGTIGYLIPDTKNKRVIKIEIGFATTNGSDSGVATVILNQILSTFKFTN